MALILHAAWLPFDAPFPDGRFFFWAENADLLSTETLQGNGRNHDAVTSTLVGSQNGYRNNDTPDDQAAGKNNGRLRAVKVPSHPFQLSAGHVRALLSTLIPEQKDVSLQPASATVWLPTVDGAPLLRRGILQRSAASAEEADDVATTASAVALQAWQITGVALPAPRVLTTLNHLDGRLHRHSGAGAWRQLRLGNDLLFWSNAAKLALEFLAGQQYLPAIRTGPDGRFFAVWQPALLDDALHWRVDQLAALMPPVCRAYELAAPEEASPPNALLEHFIAAMTDDAVRTWYTDLSDNRSPAGHWLERLTIQQRQMTLPPMLAHQLYQEWRAWIDQLQRTRDANFRICFKLAEPGAAGEEGGEEPEKAATRWTLRYYLQARDNHELLIPASQIWQTREHTLHIRNRRLDQPQERLLAGLGLASRLFAPVKRSLRAPQPTLALLTIEEAHDFLREIGPLLESAGFGIIMPAWWQADQRQSLGFTLRLTADDFSDNEYVSESADFDEEDRRAGSGPTDAYIGRPIRYEWALTLGGSTLNPKDFEQLAAKKSPLVQVRDQWVELDPEQVAAARSFLQQRRTQGNISFLDALRLAQGFTVEIDSPRLAGPPTGAGTSAGGRTAPQPELPLPDLLPAQIPLESVSVEGWLEHTLEQLRFQQPVGEIDEPEHFQGTLRPYQRRGAGWLVYLRNLGLGACLADDMGLGKTIQAIAMLLHVREEAAAAHVGETPHLPALLICPTSVVANWKHETDRFAPVLRALIHHGTGRLTGDEFLRSAAVHDLIITSYGTARRDIELLTRIPWRHLIIDEAQNIKNPRAKQTQAVRRIQAPNRVALTGTPVENRLAELWSIMEFLNPGYFGEREAFRKRFIVPIERYNDDQRAAELRRLAQPFLLRRLKSDPNIISDLPEKNEMVVYCSLTEEQAALYEATVRQALATLEESSGIQRRGQVLALLTRLKQITNHPAHFLKEEGPLAGRSGKLDRLTEMLEEALSVDDQALVFTQFVEMGHLLQNHLRTNLGSDVLFLHGGTPARQRDRMVQEFQDKSGPPVFVLSLRAGGSGLNLTRANHVFHFDRWWNPAVENQATDRAFRIGQQRNVQVHKFVVAGTLEERINEMIESKQALAEAIVGSGEDWLTELNNDELQHLLMLRRGAL